MIVREKPFSFIRNYINRTAPVSIIGFARSILALSMILTLLFNDIGFVIPSQHLSILPLHSIKFQINFFLLCGSTRLWITKWLAIFALLYIICGYTIGPAAILQAWITASFVILRPVHAGGDYITVLLTVLLVPVCLFDDRKNHWNPPEANDSNTFFIQGIFLLLIRMQVAYIYVDSVIKKLAVPEWKDGTVIYYWFTHNFFGLDTTILGFLKPILQNVFFIRSIAWGTILFEIILFLGFLLPAKVKWPLLKFGIAFHFGIVLIHGYATFFFAMSGALFLYLYPAQKKFTLNLLDSEK